MIKVRNLISSNGNPVANQFEIYDGNFITFQSYDTTICILDFQNMEVRINRDAYNYSVTTSKYLNAFDRDYGFIELNSRNLSAKNGKDFQILHRGEMWNVRFVEM